MVIKAGQVRMGYKSVWFSSEVVVSPVWMRAGAQVWGRAGQVVVAGSQAEAVMVWRLSAARSRLGRGRADAGVHRRGPRQSHYHTHGLLPAAVRQGSM